MADNWAISSLNWHQIKPPMRPSVDELALISQIILQVFGESEPGQALVLGATPEYFHLPWPASVKVMAVDNSPGMLSRVWPGPASSTVLGNWLALPLATGSMDMVLLDAGLCLLPWPTSQTRAVSEIARVLRPGGICCIRLLVLPDQPQTPAEVFAAIRMGQVPDLKNLRIYLWMALKASKGQAVSNQDVWGSLKQEFGSWSALAGFMHCDADYLEAFAEPRLTQTSRTFDFASEVEYTRLFSKPEFALQVDSIFRPAYPLGERCPTCVLRKTGLSGL